MKRGAPPPGGVRARTTLWTVLILYAPVALAADPPAEADPLPSPGQERRETRRAKRLARWTGPLLPEEADFLRRDGELRIRFGFNGYNPGPFSLFTALAGWNEFSVVGDVGAFSWRDFTVSFGGEAHYGQAFLLKAILGASANYEDVEFRWAMWEAGGSFRSAFHYTGLASTDPYVFAGVGASAFHIQSAVKGWPLVEPQTHTTPYLRVELGAGLNFPMSEHWFIGGELRYLVSIQFRPIDRFLHTNGADTATFVFAPPHRPPKGFSWVFQASYRF